MTDDELTYRALTQGSFEVSADDRFLYDLGTEYHHLTEQFDQEVCQHRNERGIAIPVSREERRACTDNARDVLDAAILRARRRGIGRDQVIQAIQVAAVRADRRPRVGAVKP